MATTTVYAGLGGRLETYDSADYSAARAGTGDGGLAEWSLLCSVGQGDYAGVKYVWESFLNFDLLGAGIPSTNVVSSAVLELRTQSDFSTTDFSIQARTHDWGGTFDNTIWVPGANLSGKTLLASRSSSAYPGNETFFEITANGSNLISACQTALGGDGLVRMVLSSDRTAAGNDPSGEEGVNLYGPGGGSGYEPKLTVTHAPAAAGRGIPFGTRGVAFNGGKAFRGNIR